MCSGRSESLLNLLRDFGSLNIPFILFRVTKILKWKCAKRMVKGYVVMFFVLRFLFKPPFGTSFQLPIMTIQYWMVIQCWRHFANMSEVLAKRMHFDFIARKFANFDYKNAVRWISNWCYFGVFQEFLRIQHFWIALHQDFILNQNN